MCLSSSLLRDKHAMNQVGTDKIVCGRAKQQAGRKRGACHQSEVSKSNAAETLKGCGQAIVSFCKCCASLLQSCPTSSDCRTWDQCSAVLPPTCDQRPVHHSKGAAECAAAEMRLCGKCFRQQCSLHRGHSPGACWVGYQDSGAA